MIDRSGELPIGCYIYLYLCEYKYKQLFSNSQIFITEMLTLFFHIVLYLISVYYISRYYKLAYSQQGIWSSLKIHPLEKFLIVLPSINTAFAIFFWLTENPIREEHRLQHLKVNGRKFHFFKF